MIMKRYIGTKLINATSMMLLAAEQLLGRSVGYKGELDTNNNAEGYLVEYQEQTKGSDKPYQAWSPKDVFEDAYRPIDNMTFGLVIEALKQGKKVARAGWNGKEMYLEIQNPDERSKMTHPYLFMTIPECKEGTRRLPWQPAQVDLFAEDWQIVE